ncbi:Lrp/AsnC family transcriptional regulator [Glycomyces sp. TRM65418]|uniref:Lrp/AsnC family transcriptional regulator n=1 Tax=Glycomyces sp. TRM65418 TaxID=2867006 RepID=UPI001CE5A29E|nr:Lrp/AsnC family transcriptional regulator [Glycomyces sp. TRM65418]MCC3765851.1 Lrp/AsnC family transcriptional regulator [Glycomyces sp. TRM65418]QZD55436.1 Lrp/AsnC family transcriptional regulator [Glycomyces sp. TRM65418]
MAGPPPKKPQTPPVPLDGTDLAILAALVEDGRMTNAALAARAGVAESTCAYRVRALRETGVLAGIKARIDPEALGRPLRAIIKVRLGSHSRELVHNLYDRLVKLPGVLTVFHVGGDDDFLLHVAVAGPEALRDLILEHVTVHPMVRQTETQLVFEVREGRGVLPG